MRDRVPTKVLENGAVRYGIYDEETGELLQYVYLRAEDEPTQIGTPLTKAVLLSDEAAQIIGLEQEDPTVSEALAALGTGKQDGLVGKEGQFLGFDEEGKPKAQGLPETGVGRTMAGKQVHPAEGTTVTAGIGAEIFNDYRERTYGPDTGYEKIIAQAGNIASGVRAHAEGTQTTATGQYAHAEGTGTTASGQTSHAEGGRYNGEPGSVASAYASHAEGVSTTSSGNGSHSEGRGTTASGAGSHAEGQNTTASKDRAHAEGISTVADGLNAHAEGSGTKATGQNSHAEGYAGIAEGSASHVEGGQITGGTVNKATGYAAHAEGASTLASGGEAHAEGQSTKAIQDNAHAEGRETTAFGYNAHAEGYMGIASGNASHVEGGMFTDGTPNKASGYAAHAEGCSTEASGDESHAEGGLTKATENCAHAEGRITVASGEHAHAEGFVTEASGQNAHAEGSNTVASGSCSHAAGSKTIASGPNQTAIGVLNVEKQFDGSMFIIGNGADNTGRSNCFRVDQDGRVFACSPWGQFSASGADYAELFEWADGNPDGEDRVGRFVTLSGPKLRLAGPGDGYLLGIVSGAPSVVGDVYDDQWAGMYLTDVFGRPVWEDVEVPAQTEEVETPVELPGEGNQPPRMGTRKETRVVIPAHTERRQKLNPAYDPARKYVPRTARPEWAAVGMLGKLVALEDGSCQVDGWCTAGEGGVATASGERTQFRVMEKLVDPETGRKCVRVMILNA